MQTETSAPAATGATALDRVARVLTEACAPSVIVVLLPLAVAWKATHAIVPALAWGLLVGLTSSILPMAVIVWGARAGRWDGHHVRDRAGRLVPFLALIGFSVLGVGLLLWSGAPWLVIALDLAMVACLVVTGVVTVWWKVSMHAAVAAGAVVVLVQLDGPLWWVLAPVAVGIGWSRVRLGDHTAPQVVAGLLVGGVAIGTMFTALLHY